jgi:hypothetical protein
MSLCLRARALAARTSQGKSNKTKPITRARTHAHTQQNAPSTVVNVTCEEYSQCKCLDLPYLSRMEFEARKAGRLRVLIEYARDVPSANTQGYPSSFIKALIAGQEQSTDIKKGTVNPIFNQRMEFLLANHDQSDVDREFLTLELYQPGAQKEDPDKLLGKVHILHAACPPLPTCAVPAAPETKSQALTLNRGTIRREFRCRVLLER